MDTSPTAFALDYYYNNNINRRTDANFQAQHGFCSGK